MAPSVAAARLLARRATMGATPAVVDRILTIGGAAWIDEQLRPDLPDAEGLLAGYLTLNGTDSANDTYRSDETRLFGELDHATLLRAVYSGRQLHEVMCQFWSSHLNVWRRMSWLTQLRTSYERDVIRPHALGRFADMLLASARSPAMLVYLDNYRSDAFAAQGVNENYGRELLELHSLGIIDGAHVYTEADVRAVAKVMSGWTINWDAGAAKYSYRFAPWQHSREALSVLGGAWSRPARTYGQGETDGVSLVTFLARHPSTARYLSWKLVRHFVDDEPPRGLVDRLAAVYLANDTAIAPVLRALFLSDEFAASAGKKVSRPFEWMTAALRATRAAIGTDPVGHAAGRLSLAGQTLGQPLHERHTPDGWPDRAVDWISAEGLLKRWEFAARLARNQVTDAAQAQRVTVDPAALLPSPLPATVRDLLVAVADRTFQYPLPPADADAIAAAANVSPTGAAGALAGSATAWAMALGLLMAHPTFLQR
ncbi:MAG: DUF1800 domain-containing protein [Microthrixaceae bacterium]